MVEALLSDEILENLKQQCFGLSGTASVSVEIIQSGGAYGGYNGRKALIELVCGPKRRRLFVKDLPIGLSEAAKYRALASVGAPVVNLLCAFNRRDGREVVVLDCLERIRINPSNQVEFGEFIDTVARFNASNADLPEAPPNQLMLWFASLRAAWERARSGAWGAEAMADAGQLDGVWPELEQNVADLEAQRNRLPLDPTHHDPAYGNVGRLDANAPLVLFDLHYCDRSPRFRDLALSLGGFAQDWPKERGRMPWIERYCASYNKIGARQISTDEAIYGVQLHLEAQHCWFDAATGANADAAYRKDPTAFQVRWGAWLRGKWNVFTGWRSSRPCT